MDWLQILVLSVVQGLTEFLPISSSAHLILVPVLTDWQDQGLAFDVAVHVGTLTAVVAYFHRELRVILGDGFASIAQRRQVGDSNLFWAVGLGTIPVGLAGLLVIETSLRSPLVLAVATILFGLLLWWADRIGKRERDEHSISWKDILFIGLAQALALIPGTSRSGITITAGLMLGLSRQAAARFSFLLSIPVILLAGGLYTIKLVQAGTAVDWSVLIGGALLSGLTAYLCIHYFLKLLERIGMLPFVIYRLLLGAVLLVIFW
ncbi:undecaprenyl-diphosphate phosphatase [Nitrosomonas sp. ANs5]|uniref:undecaprenyl-diphosphate phosphatase n=1 Tax=Nitrosomonas sp. ANs5 TaxID=3423941 RepID=UPI003D3347DC